MFLDNLFINKQYLFFDILLKNKYKLLYLSYCKKIIIKKKIFIIYNIIYDTYYDI